MSTSATESNTSGARKRGSSKTKTTGAKPSSQAGQGQGAFVCPECGKSFRRAQALGAHRSRTHRVAGTSRSARATAKRGGTTAAGRARGASKRPGGRSGRSESSAVRPRQAPRGNLPERRPAEGGRDRGARAVAGRSRATVANALSSIGPTWMRARRPGVDVQARQPQRARPARRSRSIAAVIPHSGRRSRFKQQGAALSQGGRALPQCVGGRSEPIRLDPLAL